MPTKFKRVSALTVLAFAFSVGPIACSDKEEKSLVFPPGFTFGTAVAGFQVDMGCPTLPAEECDDPNSDWFQWITDERVLANPAGFSFIGGPPATGPGFYELYAEDFARAKNELGVNSMRISIEWSRIFPTSTVGIEGYENLKEVASAKGIAYYRAQLAELKALGLVPLVTLNHYTLPLWIHDGVACHFDLANCEARGWLDPATIDEMAKYSGFVAREFGGEVDMWATQNEPLAVVLAGYLAPGPDRTNPPGVFGRAREAKTVVMALIRAHAAMYDAVKANDIVDADGDGKPAVVGLVYNLAAVRPADPDEEYDEQSAKNIDYLYNEVFLNATIHGDLDAELDGTTVLDTSLAGRMDYLGLNYYSRITVAGLENSLLPDFSSLMTLDVISGRSRLYENYPRGIYETAMFVKKRYNLPIYVTENGYSTSAEVGDAEQEKLLVETLSWLLRAMAEGADVRGYYYWTLTDNYEWNHGMDDMRFGLYAVDSKDPAKKRQKRAVADVYRRIVGAKGIPADLAKKHPIE